MEEKLRKLGTTFLKIAFSAILLYFIFTKVQFKEILEILGKTRPFYIFTAILFFAISKILAAFRLNGYFHQLRIYLTQLSNLKLYLLGMFYNLFLPGGIGGDAYKGYVIKKKFDVPTKKVVSTLILDRLSGLLLLFVYASILALFMDVEMFGPFKIVLGIGIILGVVVFWVMNKRFFAYTLPFFWKSLGFSALVQLAQLFCVLCILKGLFVETDTFPYLLVFLVSSIVAVLPLTIGGIGSREVVFFYGALWLGLEENTAISVSMVFFLITALVSLLGVIYHLKKPVLKTVNR